MNWQASFRTPDHVRREWATEHGLSEITSERYTSALDAVCTRLGVTTGAALTQHHDRSPGALHLVMIKENNCPLSCLPEHLPLSGARHVQLEDVGGAAGTRRWAFTAEASPGHSSQTNVLMKNKRGMR